MFEIENASLKVRNRNRPQEMVAAAAASVKAAAVSFWSTGNCHLLNTKTDDACNTTNKYYTYH